MLSRLGSGDSLFSCIPSCGLLLLVLTILYSVCGLGILHPASCVGEEGEDGQDDLLSSFPALYFYGSILL